MLPAAEVGRNNFTDWPRNKRRHRLPFSGTVQHLADAAAHVTSPLGICMQAAWNRWMTQGFLDAKDDRFGGEEALLHTDGFEKRVKYMLGRGRHQTEQRAPVHRGTARQVAG